jgi:hypothetical protein
MALLEERRMVYNVIKRVDPSINVDLDSTGFNDLVEKIKLNVNIIGDCQHNGGRLTEIQLHNYYVFD